MLGWTSNIMIKKRRIVKIEVPLRQVPWDFCRNGIIAIWIPAVVLSPTGIPVTCQLTVNVCVTALQTGPTHT